MSVVQNHKPRKLSWEENNNIYVYTDIDKRNATDFLTET